MLITTIMHQLHMHAAGATLRGRGYIPLDSEEVAARIGDEVKKGDLGDELVEQMSGLDVSTIDFLRIQFRDEWDNFVQRIIGKYGVQGAAAHMITERDFRISEGGLFSGTLHSESDLA